MKGFMHWFKSSTKMKRWMFLILIGIVLACYGIAEILVLKEMSFREVGKVMLAQKKGSIVNIASMSGMIVNTPLNQCAYNASKGGLIMLTKSMATEWADRGVRVNAICPGYMRTEMSEDRYQRKDPAIERWFSMTPMGRSGVPDELMVVAVYLAADASSYTTGSTYLVDGGYTAW